MSICRRCVTTFGIAGLVFLFVFPVFATELKRYDGLVEPNRVVDLGSSVRGLVEQVYVERSDMVLKGDVMVHMESSVERAMVERATALAASMGDILLQEEKYAFAKRALERMQELLSSEAISTQARDRAQSEMAMARYSLQKVKENKKLARLDLKRAEALLDLRTVRSPLSGVVVERFVSTGEFIDAQPLLRIAEIDPLKVEVIVPAEVFGTIRPGEGAKVFLESANGKELLATIILVDKVIDAASNTFGVRLQLPNPDHKLVGGLRCKVQFSL